MRRIRPAVGGVFQYETTTGARRWAVDYRDAHGLERRRAGFVRKDDAVAFRLQVEAELPGRGGMRFADVVARYLESRERLNRNRRSYCHLPAWVDVLGPRRIDRIQLEEIAAWLDRWEEERRLRPATRNRILAQISGVFTYAVERRWISRHPIRGTWLRPVREHGERDRWLRRHELEAIVAACPGWLGRIVRFGASTGMRLEEICQLRVADVQADERGRRFVIAGRTKNGDPLAWPLIGWPLEAVEERVKGSRFPGDLLFPGPTGKGARQAVRRVLPGAVRAAGLRWGRWMRDATGELVRDDQGRRVPDPDGVTFHTLRHTFASLAINAGIDARLVQRMGNWRDPRMLDRYAHLADERLREAAGKVADLIGGRSLAVVPRGTPKRQGKKRRNGD